MAATHRTQVLMEPEEHQLLQGVAVELGVSVAELMRRAARAMYLVDRKRQTQKAAMAALLALDIGPVDWEQDKADLLAARGAEPWAK